MADLSRERGTRGQILLVTALILGVSFVALALILNSAIFTENLASRGDTTGADEIVTYHDNLQDGVAGVLVFETHNATSSDDHRNVVDRMETAINDTASVMLRRHAKVGAISNASMIDHTNGSRVFQTDSSRNFSDGYGNRNWTVANGVSGTRAFRMNVSQASLGSCSPTPDCFTVNVTDASDTWKLTVADDGGVEVTVDDGTGAVSCDPVDEPFVEIDITAGTVGGEPCNALAFADGPSAPYDVEYVFSDAVAGTYSLVVDNASIADSPPGRYTASAEPFVTPTLYDLRIGYAYQTADIIVGTELRVAPGEPDGR